MKTRYYALLLPPLLAACTTLPTGPTVAVMPAPGKPFEVFAQEEQQCRAYAAGNSVDGNQASSTNLATNMALGTVIGAAAPCRSQCWPRSLTQRLPWQSFNRKD